MRLIEVPSTPGKRTFINLDRISTLILKKSGEIWLEPMIVALVQKDKSYQEVYRLLRIARKPASIMEEVEEEE